MVERSTPSLFNDPSVVFLTGILAELDAGQVQLPRFQRQSVWTLEQRLDLLDSVASGIPIGAIMLWRTQRQLAVHAKVGPHTVPAGRPLISQYIIDGGQRLAALYGALYPLASEYALEEFDEPRENFRVHYDLIERRFVTPEPNQQPPAHWLPLPAVLDTVPLLRFQRGLRGPDADEQMERADEIAKRFRAYKVPILALASDDLELATTTFKRVNSTGTPMSEPDMVSALVWTESFDLNNALKVLREDRLAPFGWQELDSDILLRCIKMTLGFDIYEGAEHVSAAIKQKPDCIARTADALERVATFLRDHCGIWGPNLVPYSHQIPLLVRAFDIVSVPSEALREKLVAWVWLTTYAELFASMSGYRLGVVTEGVDRLARSGKLSWTATKAFSRRPLPARFDFRHARSRALASRLADLKVGGGQELAEHGASAVSKLINRGPGSDSPGNRFLVGPADRAQLMERLSAGEADICRTHAVSDAARLFLQRRQFQQFISQRASDLDAMEEAFVTRWTATVAQSSAESKQLELLKRTTVRRASYVSYLRGLEELERKHVIEDFLSETAAELLNEDAVIAAMADTNASDFDIEGIEVTDIQFRDDECTVALTYIASGEQNDERMYAGTTVSGTAKAIIHDDGSVDYEDVAAEIQFGDDD